jgi:hypothetical protein
MAGVASPSMTVAALSHLADPTGVVVRQYYSPAAVSIAIGALLAAAVPLALTERGRAPFGEPGLTLVWLVNYAVFGYAIGGLLVWATGIRPAPAFAVSLLPFLAWHAALRVERARRSPPRPPGPTAGNAADDVERRMVEATLRYAEVLAEQHKDRALLALRASASRTLHLLGAHQDRVRLGALSLHAAQRVGDVEAEASILLDDLGWANHEVGADDDARQSIVEAIDLLKDAAGPLPDAVPVAVRVLLVRGHRHLGAMVEPSDLPAALAHIAEAEAAMAGLPEQTRRTEQAALDVVRGDLVATHFARTRGPGSRFPDGTAEATQVSDAMSRVDSAVDVFETVGDLERAAKAAAIHQRLAAHRPSQRTKEASLARLERLERMVVRDITRWRGGARNPTGPRVTR